MSEWYKDWDFDRWGERARDIEIDNEVYIVSVCMHEGVSDMKIDISIEWMSEWVI